MDYLAFGLLAGSLIVIASFVIRDGLPHLSAITGGSHLGRFSRATTPIAWARWCADSGLVLAGMGTVILVVTGATLLADPSDGAGNVVVGVGVAVAAVASVLGVARLTQRLRAEAAAELAATELAGAPPSLGRRGNDAAPRARQGQAEHMVEAPPAVVERYDPEAFDAPGDVWTDDLPTWSAPTQRPVEPIADVVDPTGTAVDLGSSDGNATEPSTIAWGAARVDPVAEPEPPRPGGVFSSPLLADIGLTSTLNEHEDRFTSPLLSDLERAEPGEEIDPASQSDLLIDEAPAPVQSSGRHRDEIDGR